MHGFVETYEEEIKNIMSWTDDEIIEWMKQHNVDFQTATKASQDSFIHSWKETLEEWRKAFEDVTDEVVDLTSKPALKKPSSSSSSGGKSGGGSSGGGGGKTSSSGVKPSKGAQFVASGTGYAEMPLKNATIVKYNGVQYVDDPKTAYWYKRNDGKIIDAGRTLYFKTGTTRYLKRYATGGIADYTGFAMLDGSKTRPERILSAYQTQLFEDLLSTLHVLRTVQTPSFMSVSSSDYSGSSGGFTIEELNINVDRMDSDKDIEDVANRVCKELEKQITRGKAVGGIRIR